MLGILLGLVPGPTGDTASPWAAIGMVLLMVGFAVFMTFSIRGKIARRNAARLTPRELIEQMKSHPRMLASDTHTYTAQLQDTARRLSGQLDNKARRLEMLIDEADQRIAALAGQAEPATRRPAQPAAQPTPGNGEHQADELTRAVYGQADAGRTVLEIAQQLDEQIGKVELILALRATSGSCRSPADRKPDPAV